MLIENKLLLILYVVLLGLIFHRFDIYYDDLIETSIYFTYIASAIFSGYAIWKVNINYKLKESNIVFLLIVVGLGIRFIMTLMFPLDGGSDAHTYVNKYAPFIAENGLLYADTFSPVGISLLYAISYVIFGEITPILPGSPVEFFAAPSLFVVNFLASI